MLNSLIIFSSILIIACGRQVSLDTSKIEGYSNVTDVENFSVDKEGLLVKGAETQIHTEGKKLTVSKYSSYIALSFIAAQAPGSQVQVKFKGKILGSTVLIELIEAK